MKEKDIDLMFKDFYFFFYFGIVIVEIYLFFKYV
jgi:hypothetical protein